MTWDDVDAILFDGTEEQIRALRCPDCGSELKYAYFPDIRNMEIRCDGCGTLIRAHGVHYVPNFTLYNLDVSRRVG